MRIAIGLLGLTMLMGISVPVQLPAQEWTRFRGPNGSGASEATTVPVNFDEDDYNWKTRLPGIGHSSPVLWGDRVFLMSADPDSATRYVICLDAESGDILWNREFDSQVHRLHSRNSFASGTPAVDEKHVYVAWSDPTQVRLMAFDHDGSDAWERDLGTWVSQHGFGASPIVYQDKVILFNSQQKDQVRQGEPGESHMMAFDRETGDTVWSTPMKATRVCYSVPCIYTNEQGEDELLGCNTGNGIFSLDPDSGELNWEIDLFEMRTVASTYLAGGLVFGSNGSGGGGNYIVGVKPGKNPQEVFRVTTSANYVPTPIAHEDMLFLWYDKGIVSCIDLESGDTVWRERVAEGFSGSPIRIGDKLYGISEAGELLVIAARRDFDLLAKVNLGEPSRSTPAVADGVLYLRTESHLISVGGE